MDAFDQLVMLQTDGGKRIGTAPDHVIGLVPGGLLAWFRNQAKARKFPFGERIEGSVKACINHGHWIVRCPYCVGAEEADPAEPIFYCLSCGNSGNRGRLLGVEFPEEREEIEGLLLKRPIANRNWEPGETVEFLRAESAEHGQGMR